MADEQAHLFETDPAPWELDSAVDRLVATIVFPEAPRGEFDYLIPDSLSSDLQPGARVRVPLGRGNRKVMGYCIEVGTKVSTHARLKAVKEVLDKPPLISPEILNLARWIAAHYVCDLGSALEAVVPAGVRGEAGTRKTMFFELHPEVAGRWSEISLPPKQALVLAHVAGASAPETMAAICLAAGCTSGPVTALVKKGVLRSFSRRVFLGDLEAVPVPRGKAWPLCEDQANALKAIGEALDSGMHQTLLLHGVTGSGKTEVYIQAIEKVVGFGRQAIVLVPEISLTPQTRQRFRSRFDRVAVLHSNLSHVERNGEWRRIARGEVQVVVGARSAVFAPVPHLGLIVIDESHEPSFKQDTAPRYHARHVAQRRASQARVPLILGSATPSLESWHAAQTGRYRLISMPQRVMERPLPHVHTIDMRDEYRHRDFGGGAISRRLAQSMKLALNAKQQIILLLNRRGFSTHIQCPACGVAVRCENCDIALTHHRQRDVAICHYCNYQRPTPRSCPECGFEGIRFSGLGTEKLEAEVAARFPGAKCLRMDTDTMRARGAHEVALDQFRRGDVDILLGTQMIAKGLDFPNVTLVGVINADTGLNLPDFRASERTFQLVTQVAGRTGRGEKGGMVMVQTFSPQHRAIRAAATHDFAGFAVEELPEREEFYYPPFSSIFRLVFRGKAESITQAFAEQIADRVTDTLDSLQITARVLGPVPAPISRLQGRFRFHMLIQAADRNAVAARLGQLKTETVPPDDTQWIIDADAVSML